MDKIAAEVHTRLVKATEKREEGAEGLQVAIIAGITGAACVVLALAFKSKMVEYWDQIGG